MWGNKFLDFLSSLLLGIGSIFMISPIFLIIFIHGDYDRYIWIINGPFPFNSFGGGPFQLFMYLVLFIVGVTIIHISRVIKSNLE